MIARAAYHALHQSAAEEIGATAGERQSLGPDTRRSVLFSKNT
jgi:hypothetical protein